MKKYLFCAARGHQGHWEAVCFDLCLMVEGRSFEEVEERLTHSIVTYIEDALKEDEPARTELLNRRAPFLVRVGWMWPLFISNIFGGSRYNNNPSVGFTAACPA